jgi:hypothetical protein
MGLGLASRLMERRPWLQASLFHHPSKPSEASSCNVVDVCYELRLLFIDDHKTWQT